MRVYFKNPGDVTPPGIKGHVFLPEHNHSFLNFMDGKMIYIGCTLERINALPYVNMESSIELQKSYTDVQETHFINLKHKCAHRI